MSLYEVLKASKTERFPDYWTLLFAEHVGGTGEWTVTGVLPLTFTAKGGTAADWVIEGNDDVGENLINVADFTVGVTETHNVFNGILPAGTYTAAVYQNTALTSAERNTLVILKTSGAIYESANTNYHLAAGWHYLTFTITESENVSLRYWTVNASNSVNCTSVMLVKGSTAPEHYIPYQQGVGEWTKNLFNPNEQIIIGGLTYIGGTYPAGKYRVYNVSNFPCYYKIGESGATGTVNTPNNVYLNAGDIVYVWCSISSNRKICVSEGSTAIPYEPYGYQIPITVSQDGQPDKTYDIYIGDSPLTEGQQVSKTSTGQDIEIFGGENTVSTTLYNKPEMEIRYK